VVAAKIPLARLRIVTTNEERTGTGNWIEVTGRIASVINCLATSSSGGSSFLCGLAGTHLNTCEDSQHAAEAVLVFLFDYNVQTWFDRAAANSGNLLSLVSCRSLLRGRAWREL
jgi:hypothetical protein